MKATQFWMAHETSACEALDLKYWIQTQSTDPLDWGFHFYFLENAQVNSIGQSMIAGSIGVQFVAIATGCVLWDEYRRWASGDQLWWCRGTHTCLLSISRRVRVCWIACWIQPIRHLHKIQQSRIYVSVSLPKNHYQIWLLDVELSQQINRNLGRCKSSTNYNFKSKNLIT